MSTELSSDYGLLIAERIRSSHREIALRWLERLNALLPLDAHEIFPSDTLLDHVPALITEIADYVAAGTADSAAANTAILSKAHELGELRFSQRASVHQLLREYRLLGTVLADFVRTEFDAMPGAGALDGIAILARLNEAVFVLLQMTVDTFVGRYTDKIEEQTTRLEGFNRMVSHELRQPLSSLLYAVELLGSDAAADGARRTKLLQVSSRSVRRLGELVRMLSALARPDRDGPQTQTVDLAQVVDDAMRQMREVADAKGVVLYNRVEAGGLTVDVARLELVLINLLSNAIKYRDPRKPEAFVEISCTSDGDVRRLHVRDNGLGIAAADQPHVFRRSYRAHASKDGELGNDGLGLGLGIVVECVKALRATIALDSTEGLGTTFTVTLPADPSSTPRVTRAHVGWRALIHVRRACVTGKNADPCVVEVVTRLGRRAVRRAFRRVLERMRRFRVLSAA